MLKFGNLFLNNGSLNGNQIISSEWIKESTTALYKIYDNIGYYVYHWWVSSFNNNGIEINYYFALGYGGQYIIIVPEFDLVVVFTSRIYNNPLRPMYYFKGFILKAIEEKKKKKT
jgi:CubicO group peptidase (beta-lactamase class C family)